MQCIGKLFTLIEESCTNNIVKLSDFNATLNSVFEGELLEMCSTLIIITRCTRGDASSFFLYLQNVFVCIKRNFL